MSEATLCPICNGATSSKAEIIFKCELCTSSYHAKCDSRYSPNVSRTQIPTPQNVDRYKKMGFIWLCELCTPKCAAITAITEIRACLNELNNKVSCIESIFPNIPSQPKSDPQNKSYAKVVRERNIIENTFIVKTNTINNEQESVSEKIKSCINPTESKISNLIDLKDNQCIIKTTSSDVDKVLSGIKEKLGDDYNVELVGKKKPRLKIVGYENVSLISENDIAEAIKIQNDNIFSNNDEIKIVKIITNRNRNNSQTIIIEVNSELHKAILKQGAVSIEFSKCKVYDSVDIARCFKCSKLGHYANKCENNICCPKCAGEHKLEECKSKALKCVNCSDSNTKYKLKLDVNHGAFDKKCPTMLNRVKSFKKSLHKQ